jgi:hypothetical protein
MISVLFIKQVHLVIQNFDTYEHCSFVFSASTKGFHLAGGGVFLVCVFVVVAVSGVNFVKKEGEQNHVVIEIL